MTHDEFLQAIQTAVQIGYKFDNPGGGTSEIIRMSDTSVSYQRGKSSIQVAFDDLYVAYERFQGGQVSSTDLRDFAPSVFDSSARPAGHSCNCTFFFHLMQKIGLAGSLRGAGVRGNPYRVELGDDLIR